MIQLTYVSSVKSAFTDEQITDILDKSRKNNARDGISGVLLCMYGSVIQVLEGDEDKVHRLFDVIQKDKRHYNVTLLYEENIKHRDFESWAMGFRLIDTTLSKFPEGSWEIRKLVLEVAPKQPSRGHRMLATFANSFRWAH